MPAMASQPAVVVNDDGARVAGLLAVAALPLVAGLSGAAYNNPNLLEPAYRTAMWVCASLLAAGECVGGVPRTPTRAQNTHSTAI